MSMVTIQLEDEQVDSIVVQELRKALEMAERDLEARSDGEGLAFFDHDPIKDVLYIQEMITSFTNVLEYYGG